MSLDNVKLSIKNLDLFYGDNQALKDINIDIKENKVTALIGPSGCGKSTLLNIIAGFLKPTEGEARMNGEIIDGASWERAVVFQTPTLYPWLNIHDNVAFGPNVRHLPKDQTEELTKKYLNLVELGDFGDHKPYELSGGMRQRASLARVLVNQPGMILMDEPFGALDALTRQNMQTLIRKIWSQTQNTVFLITHDVDEALALATRVIVMSSRPGRIVKQFETDFTYDIGGVNKESARYTREYMQIREEILNIINEQNETLKL